MEMSILIAHTNEDIKKLMLDAKKFVIAPELTQVEIAPLQWSDDNFSLFINAISKHHKLKALYLTGAQVSYAQYHALFEALKTHPSLKRLFMGKFLPPDLETNQLAIERFSKFMQQNTTIRVLDLSSNHFEDAYGSNMNDIAKIIEHNRSLKTLHLSAVSMRDKGMTLVAQAMKKNTTLLELNLSFNSAEADGYKALFAALEENITLLKLDVTDLPMNVLVVNSLSHYLQHTKTLLCLRGRFSSLSLRNAFINDLNHQISNAFYANTSLLNCQLTAFRINETNNHLKENYASARTQRNDIIIACITFARRLEDILAIFPMEIWLNIFRFVTMWSRRYLRTRSSNIFSFICDNIATINAYLVSQTKFRIVQQQKRSFIFLTYK